MRLFFGVQKICVNSLLGRSVWEIWWIFRGAWICSCITVVLVTYPMSLVLHSPMGNVTKRVESLSGTSRDEIINGKRPPLKTAFRSIFIIQNVHPLKGT